MSHSERPTTAVQHEDLTPPAPVDPIEAAREGRGSKSAIDPQAGTSHSKVSPAGFAVRMRELARLSAGDAEATHSEMDSLMCEVLRDFGYGEGVDAFEVSTRWYA